MKLQTTFLPALAAIAFLLSPDVRADNMATIAITPATGAVTLVPRWAIGGNLAGFHHMAQDLSLGGGANQFYSIKSTPIPAGGDIAAFTRYIAGSGAATNHTDIGSKLTPNSYSALTSADPDIGYGAVNFYFIHHKATGDYFTTIVPSSGTASAVTDLKPMSGPGGPATLGASGYFGLTFAAANLGYDLNLFYYLRTDAVTGFTKFGTLAPALLGTSADKFDLGVAGHNALAFTGTDVGYGADKMYYLRLDPVTGFTILGTLHPLTGRVADIANLGSVFSTLTFAPGDVGFGPGRFYVAGAVNPTWQSVSFAAIADRLVNAGSFAVAPSASSGLPIALTVVAGSTGSATISGPVGGVFTVTPTGPGVITLQATQAGQTAPTPFEYNMLRQSFTATGVPVITNSPLTAAGALGTPFTFAITAAGSPTSYSASPLPAGLAINTTTGVISGTPTVVGTTTVQLGATTALGTGSGSLTIAVGPAVSTLPVDRAVVQGGSGTFAVGANGGGAVLTYQWQKNGVNLSGATNASLVVDDVQPEDVGLYAVVVTGTGTSTTTVPALLTMTFAGRTAGSITEVSANVALPNGSTYDQFLLTGVSASLKADAGQIARLSFVDLSDDIVQVEFSGAGVLTISLENASGPLAPARYNQPGVTYMKGHAALTVTGANATTNLSVYSVGPVTSVNRGLFRAGTAYDGWADIALVVADSADGSFGGLRTANASYFRAHGMTGIYAPGVELSGPLFVNDISAADTASPFLVLGAVTDARITGGDLFQANSRAVEVSGVTRLQFTAGTSSQGVLLPPGTNQARLMSNGVDVTGQLVPGIQQVPIN